MAPRDCSLTIDEFCAARRITRKTLENWRRDGLPTRRRSKQIRIDLADVAEWELERAKRAAVDALNRPKPALDRETEQARKLAAEATIAERKLAELDRELMPAAVVREEMERLVGGFAAVTMGRLETFERDIVAAVTPADARRLVYRIQDALMAGAQQFADELDAEADAAEEVAA
jgi:hypothetical protein